MEQMVTDFGLNHRVQHRLRHRPKNGPSMQNMDGVTEPVFCDEIIMNNELGTVIWRY